MKSEAKDVFSHSLRAATLFNAEGPKYLVGSE